MATPNLPLGIVRPDAIYTLECLKAQVGIKDAGMRAARRAGLMVHYRHGRAFVLGSDFIGYILNSQHSAEEPG